MAIVFSPSINPSFPLAEDDTLDVLSARFGEGYEERKPNGLNSRNRDVSLTWEGLTREERDEIRDFVHQRKGSEPFTCAFLDDPHALYVASRIKSNLVSPDNYELSLTLRRVFDVGA